MKSTQRFEHGVDWSNLCVFFIAAPNLRDLIVERAAGSPFYTEELIKMLIEDDVIVKGGGTMACKIKAPGRRARAADVDKSAKLGWTGCHRWGGKRCNAPLYVQAHNAARRGLRKHADAT